MPDAMTEGPSARGAVHPPNRIWLGGSITGKSARLTQAYISHVHDGGLSPENVLCLSFFPANAEAIRRALRPHFGEFLPWVTTLQRFQTLYLRDHADAARLPPRAREISSAARSLVTRQAWAEVGGPLWREYGERPGAIGELSRVVDWVSQNRARFMPVEGELGDHELAQVYDRYISLCAERRLLTFQEASLRCLDLLADQAIAAEAQARFPVVLVDDLHLARPDQLALIARLRGPETRFTATAWLEPGHAAPELEHVWEAIQNWGEMERLPSPAPGVNRAIATIVDRLASEGGQVPGGHPASDETESPITLVTPFTAEDEMHAAAQAMARALIQDESLRPSDLLIAAADASLVPFAQRVLAEYGLPAAPLQPSGRHTPLIRGGLLALRWALAGPEAELERDLLSLPYAQVGPLDLEALYGEATAREKTILELAPDEMPALTQPTQTAAVLDRVRRCLQGLASSRPASDIIQSAARELGGLAWVWDDAEFAQAQRDAWAQAFLDWLRDVRELEETASSMEGRPDDILGLVEGLADQAFTSQADEGIRVIDSARANGASARLAFVVGVSENAIPALHPEMQLIAEEDLPGLFADGLSAILPKARDQAAWIEREARRLAVLLSRGREGLQVSVSRYTPAGEAQLPSPLFERLLGDDGEIDRDGNIVVTRPGPWTRASAPGSPSPESLLPILDSLPLSSPKPKEGEQQVLQDHTFSASQLRTYLTCPLQFFYGRVLGIEAEERGALARGALLHEVLCATVGDGTLSSVDLTGRPRPAWMEDAQRLSERALAALDAAWGGESVDLPGGGHYAPSMAWGLRFGPELQRQAVRRWADRALADWAEFEIAGLPDNESRRPVLLEVPFAIEVEGFRITGRIDRVDEVETRTGPAYDVIDYKTGRSGAESLRAQVKKFLPPDGASPADYQLPLYALALMNGIHGLQAAPRELNLINLGSLKKKGGKKYVDRACRRIRLVNAPGPDYENGLVPLRSLTGEVTRGIVSTLTAMSTSPYPPVPDRHCTRCAFSAACDRGRAEAGGAA